LYNYESLIEFVTDRPGHDLRSAVDTRKIRREIGWTPQESFSSDLRKTISWYVSNSGWIEAITSGSYRQ
jgi:dTDP-glucose 4,6-dehydratase